MSLPRFVETLLQLDNELDATDIADVLWLARFMQNGIAGAAPGPVPPAPPTKPAGPGIEPSPALVNLPTKSEKPPVPSLEVTPFSSDNNKANPKGGGRLDFRSPAAHALPACLELSRALRPFRRRVPAARDFELDERATVQRVAEQGRQWPITPVLRPRPSRWLELTLVVDTGTSMKLWRQTVREFTTLLEGLGAFSQVQLWSMGTDRADRLTFQPGFRANGEAASLRSSLPVTGNANSVVMLLTDGVSAAWHSGKVEQWLKAQGQRHSVVVVQLLPPSLWIRTAFGPPLSGLCYPAGPVAPNRRLELLTTDNRLVSPPGPQSLVVPVLTLEEGQLASWARLVVRGEPAWLPVLVLDDQKLARQQESRRNLPEPAPPSDAERLAFFEANASPLAQRLAALLSAAPVTLPVVRLIQQTMLPQARTSHQAEVFLGGLLQKRADHADPDYVEYEFIGELRELLAARLSKLDNLKVLQQVSEYIGRRSGHPFDFRAFLLDPSQTGEELAGGGLPFARVAAEVLDRLGENFRQASARLRALEQQPPVPPAFPGSPSLPITKPVSPEVSSEVTTNQSQVQESAASQAGLQIPFQVAPDEPTLEVIEEMRVDLSAEAVNQSFSPIFTYLQSLGDISPELAKIIQVAEQEAARRGHACVGGTHLLFGLLKNEGNAGLALLQKLNLPTDKLLQYVVNLLIINSSYKEQNVYKYGLTENAFLSLQQSYEEAQRLALDKIVDSQHLLLGLAFRLASSSGTALDNYGLTYNDILQNLPELPLVGPTGLNVIDYLETFGQPYSEKVRQVLITAQGIGRRLGHANLGTSQVVLALLTVVDNSALDILNNLDLPIAEIQARLENAIGRTERQIYNEINEYNISNWLAQALQRVALEANRLSLTRTMDTHHLLLGILHTVLGTGGDVLKEAGITYDLIIQAIPNPPITGPTSLTVFDLLEQKGYVINDEIRRAMILAQRAAHRSNRAFLSVDDIVLGILEVNSISINDILSKQGLTAEQVKEAIVQTSNQQDWTTYEADEFGLNKWARRAVEYAGKIDSQLDSIPLELEDFLLSILEDTESFTAQITLPTLGLTAETLMVEPGGLDDYLNKADEYYNLGSYRDAIKNYTYAIELEPYNGNVYHNRGRAYYALEQYDHAMQDYNTALSIYPNDAFCYLDRGAIFEKREQYEQALNDYNKAIDLVPDISEAFNKRGSLYEITEQYDEALNDYNWAIALEPNSNAAYYNRGRVYSALERYEQALSDYNMAIEIDSANPFYYSARGEVYEKLEQYKQALLDYVRAIEFYPDNPEFYYKRGQVHEHLGLYNEALMDYKLADRFDPTNPIAYQNIEHLEMILKEYGQDKP